MTEFAFADPQKTVREPFTSGNPLPYTYLSGFAVKDIEILIVGYDESCGRSRCPVQLQSMLLPVRRD